LLQLVLGLVTISGGSTLPVFIHKGPLSPAIPPWVGTINTGDGFGHLGKKMAHLKLRHDGMMALYNSVYMNMYMYMYLFCFCFFFVRHNINHTINCQRLLLLITQLPTCQIFCISPYFTIALIIHNVAYHACPASIHSSFPMTFSLSTDNFMRLSLLAI